MKAGSRRLTLILVRHGETAFNAEGRIQGHLDVPLSEEGRTQARLLARRLGADWAISGRGAAASNAVALPGPPRYWFSSDLGRASETATILRETATKTGKPSGAATPPLLLSPLLRERYFGARQGLTADEARARFSADAPFEGESADAVWRRMADALSFIWQTCASSTSEDAVALVAGHGGTLRAFLCFALGASSPMMNAFPLANTSVSIVELNGGSPSTAKGRVVLVNDTAHLSPAFRSNEGGY